LLCNLNALVKSMDELRYKILIVDDEASFRNSL
jgi:hypothetical protein